MRVLVCGGAGFIGSHVVLELKRVGWDPIIVDNFVNSQLSVVERLSSLTNTNLQVCSIDLTNRNEVLELFLKFNPDAIIQLAGLKSVTESTSDPLLYYANNLQITSNVLFSMSEVKCSKIVFSSSATVYGLPKYLPIDELHTITPINPYGRTKYFQEQIIKDWILAQPYDASAVILRYFNPVGADASGMIGEAPNGVPNNLMPILGQVAMGERNSVTVLGTDYETRDGTCERDYIHVSDLATAHVAALQSYQTDKFEVFNVGTGRGVTVNEAIEAYSALLNKPLPRVVGSRRLGDAPSSVAAVQKIEERLHWRSNFTFEDACRHDLRWRRNQHG